MANKIQDSSVKGPSEVTHDSRLINSNKIYITSLAKRFDQAVADGDLGPGSSSAVGILDNGVTEVNAANSINFAEGFEVTSLSVMSDWLLLSYVTPGLSTYVSPTATQAVINVEDKFALKRIACETSVYVGAFVRFTSGGVIANARADAKSTSKVIGMVEAIYGGTECDVRVKGLASVTLSSLDVTEDYYLSPSVAGAKTSSRPSSSGQYAVSLGQALNATQFFVNIGSREQIT
jgi:hypothetical protein